MNFNKNLEIKDKHSFLSPSGYHWLRYDENKLRQSFINNKQKIKGDQLHKLAADLISLGQKLPKSNKTLNAYVNDAIGYKMTPEQPLFYSKHCFGTADAISFRKNFLRIHDYKSGVLPANMDQLRIYAALFCLEYKYKPNTLDIELRIYQSDNVLYHEPTDEELLIVMDKIITFDKILTNIEMEEE